MHNSTELSFVDDPFNLKKSIRNCFVIQNSRYSILGLDNEEWVLVSNVTKSIIHYSTLPGGVNCIYSMGCWIVLGSKTGYVKTIFLNGFLIPQRPTKGEVSLHSESCAFKIHEKNIRTIKVYFDYLVLGEHTPVTLTCSADKTTVISCTRFGKILYRFKITDELKKLDKYNNIKAAELRDNGILNLKFRTGAMKDIPVHPKEMISYYLVRLMNQCNIPPFMFDKLYEFVSERLREKIREVKMPLPNEHDH